MVGKRKTMPTASSLEKAELCKRKGNVFYKQKCFHSAIHAYTEAITLCSDVPVYWTNRAMCYKQMKKWEIVERDCRRAIELDSKSSKAHYLLGFALIERQEYALGIKELEKALDIEQFLKSDSEIVKYIHEIVAKTKYEEWEISSCTRRCELEKLKERCEIALIEYNFLHDLQDESSSREAEKCHLEGLELLKDVFAKVSSNDTPTEVPDYLCCKITLDVFRDPVITPSGITYERETILEHLNKVGNFDPTTRERLEEHQLVPNLAIKAAVQAYLNEHGWAYNRN